MASCENDSFACGRKSCRENLEHDTQRPLLRACDFWCRQIQEEVDVIDMKVEELLKQRVALEAELRQVRIDAPGFDVAGF